MDRGAWQATVHKVAKSRTQLKQLSLKKKKKATKANIHKLGNLKQHKFMILQFYRLEVQHECYCPKSKAGFLSGCSRENPLLDFQFVEDAQIPWICPVLPSVKPTILHLYFFSDFSIVTSLSVSELNWENFSDFKRLV